MWGELAPPAGEPVAEIGSAEDAAVADALEPPGESPEPQALEPVAEVPAPGLPEVADETCLSELSEPEDDGATRETLELTS